MDIGIAVKKIVTIPQKYALPESTCSFLPFSDETARAAQSSATIPAKICIGIEFLSSSLLNCVFKFCLQEVFLDGHHQRSR